MVLNFRTSVVDSEKMQQSNMQENSNSIAVCLPGLKDRGLIRAFVTFSAMLWSPLAPVPLLWEVTSHIAK